MPLATGRDGLPLVLVQKNLTEVNSTVNTPHLMELLVYVFHSNRMFKVEERFFLNIPRRELPLRLAWARSMR